MKCVLSTYRAHRTTSFIRSMQVSVEVHTAAGARGVGAGGGKPRCTQKHTPSTHLACLLEERFQRQVFVPGCTPYRTPHTALRTIHHPQPCQSRGWVNKGLNLVLYTCPQKGLHPSLREFCPRMKPLNTRATLGTAVQREVVSTLEGCRNLHKAVQKALNNTECMRSVHIIYCFLLQSVHNHII